MNGHDTNEAEHSSAADLGGLLMQLMEDRRGQPLTTSERRFYVAIRQSLIMMLGAVGDKLGMKHSIIPRHEQRRG